MRSKALKRSAALVAFWLAGGGIAAAAAAFNCGSFAMMGGAEILCSHIDPSAPAQICNFSWDLMSSETGQTIVNGTFTLPPGVSNAVVYQGSGFSYPLANPIILCQGQ